MTDTAAHLVDRVFPIVPVRQWVLSLPFALRYRMVYDAHLTSDVPNVFVRVLFGQLRRRASKQELGYQPTSVALAVRDAYECFLRRGVIRKRSK
ncbi:MAG: hypothetical protein AUH28_19740 [Acidobacteria bacterium 13_1_40CM_56_16]|nr:MAG: hypothetical protein AUH28_19740 [Acidobacteria bacterium 13_1_40CM_56_16]